MKFIRKNGFLISLIVLIFIIIVFIVTKIYLDKKASVNYVDYVIKDEDITKDDNTNLIETTKEKEDVYYKVDIKGEIVNPGVYEVISDSRVIDVVFQAGGFTDKANTSLNNLAKKVQDEMVIIIYSNDEILNNNSNNNNNNNAINNVVKVIEKECICPNIKNDSCINIKDIELNNAEKEEVLKIDLNNCTLDELLEVSGLGQVKAQAILDYQKEFGFTTVEDLLKVNGIGQATYEKIKNFFTT